MSLINQMLQELDARRSDVPEKAMYGQQVRAVPERRRLHPAWWVASLLAVALLAMVAWILLRPAPAVPIAEKKNQLPLKLETDLTPPAGLPFAKPGSILREHVDEPVKTNDATAPSGNTQKQEPAAVQVFPERAPVQEKSVESAKPPVNVAPVTDAPALPATRAAQPRTEASVTQSEASALPAATIETIPAPVINKQVRELTPQQRAENEFRKALQSLQVGRTGEAVAGLEQAIVLDARHVTARQTLIGVLLDNKRQEDAMQLAREGLAVDPAQSGLAMILARLQVEKGELRSAIETLEHGLPHAAERADFRAFLAALLQRNEQHKQAAEHYQQVLQKSPQNGVWWMGLGISLQADQRLDEAREAFKRAKASNSLSPELHAFVDTRLNQLQR